MSSKDKCKYYDVILLLSLLGANHHLPLLHKRMNKFSIGYMVKPKLNVNKMFRYQVENFLQGTFHASTMSGIYKKLKK